MVLQYRPFQQLSKEIRNLFTQAKIRSFLANPTHRQWIISLLKVLILLFLSWAIYQQVFRRDDLDSILEGFRTQFRWENARWIGLACLLMPLNWVLETIKWRALLRPELELPFRRALACVLAGISVSLFTPNRVGEYGGRLLGIPAGQSWLALAATFIGSMAQWVALLLGGLWGLASIGPDLLPFIGRYYAQYRWLLWGGALLFPVLYIHMGYFWEWIKGLRFLQTPKWQSRFKLQSRLGSYKRKTLLWVLLIACCRYLIYSTQYLLLLYGFGFQPALMTGLAGIGLIFLAQTSIPLPPVMALVARGELALLLWTGFGANELSILAATFSLFIINLLVPALLGGVTIVRIK